MKLLAAASSLEISRSQFSAKTSSKRVKPEIFIFILFDFQGKEVSKRRRDVLDVVNPLEPNLNSSAFVQEEALLRFRRLCHQACRKLQYLDSLQVCTLYTLLYFFQIKSDRLDSSYKIVKLLLPFQCHLNYYFSGAVCASFRPSVRLSFCKKIFNI